MVFWDCLRQLDAHDAETGRLVLEHAYTWTDQVVVVEGRDQVRIPSFGYSMRRRQLLELLRSRATDVGVHIDAGRVLHANAVARSADLVIPSAGVNSTLRRQQADSGTRLSDCEFDTYTFPFVRPPAGWVWAMHTALTPTRLQSSIWARRPMHRAGRSASRETRRHVGA